MKKRALTLKFEHKISFLENKSGSELDRQQWQHFVDSYASIIPLTDKRFVSMEQVTFGSVISEEFFLFQIRYIKGLNTDMRIKFQNEIYFSIKIEATNAKIDNKNFKIPSIY